LFPEWRQQRTKSQQGHHSGQHSPATARRRGGGDGDDTIQAGNRNNAVNGNAGNDRMTTGTGNGSIDGGPGTDDRYNAGTGKNTVKNCEGLLP
jgi:RTX calcium-binding nonapeptide repeat (4 copies)